jgi:Zn-finger nucleic acid-binding protein
MDCPRCAVELTEITHEDTAIHRCPECGGLWVVDAADVNKILLHANLPALLALGGMMNPDEIAGMCPACNVDLVTVEGGEKKSLHYDTCESCGGLWIEGEEDEPAEALDWKGATTQVVGFFKRFAKKK